MRPVDGSMASGQLINVDFVGQKANIIRNELDAWVLAKVLGPGTQSNNNLHDDFCTELGNALRLSDMVTASEFSRDPEARHHSLPDKIALSSIVALSRLVRHTKAMDAAKGILPMAGVRANADNLEGTYVDMYSITGPTNQAGGLIVEGDDFLLNYVENDDSTSITDGSWFSIPEANLLIQLNQPAELSDVSTGALNGVEAAVKETELARITYGGVVLNSTPDRIEVPFNAATSLRLSPYLTPAAFSNI
jgi:hypothetical protein